MRKSQSKDRKLTKALNGMRESMSAPKPGSVSQVRRVAPRIRTSERQRCIQALKDSGLSMNAGETLEGGIRNLGQIAVVYRDLINEINNKATEARFFGKDGKHFATSYRRGGEWLVVLYDEGDPIRK